MDFAALVGDRAPLIAAMSALAAAAAVIGAAWPYLQRDQLETRLRLVEHERELIRRRERSRLEASRKNPATLRLNEPRKVYTAIVDMLGMGERAESSDTRRRLRMAGYRGPAAPTTYVAVRMLAALSLFVVTLVYVYLVLRLAQPAPVMVMFAALAGAVGYFAPPIYIKNCIDKRQREISRSWPDALDLMLICIEAGMSIENVFRKVAEEIGVQSAVMAEELSLTTAELSYLQDRRRAYENLAERTGVEAVRGVVTSLVQSEKYGTPLARAIRVLAQESRDMRMAEAEKKAAALPPKLTVPMVLFFMPVLFAIITAPAIIQIAQT